MEMINLLDELPEPRQGNAIRHNLKDVVMIGIMSILCNGEGYMAMQIFGETHEELLREFLELPKGIPSHDTFGDIFSALDPSALAGCFEKWVKEMQKTAEEARFVSIDGKTIRRSKGRTKRATHVVTAFASQLKLVLGQVSTDEKSNEITAIPELLQLFCVKGKVITIDAMGTQTAIAQKIVERGGDYVLSLKQNQPTMLEDISLYLEKEVMPKKKADIEKAGLYAKSVEKGHGRIETRECYLCDSIDWLPQREDWAKLQGAGVIIAKREIGGEITVQKHFFIYSLQNAVARELLEIKRSHWSIENSLHWVLDMTFREDECRARTAMAALNLNLLRKLALQLIKSELSVSGSVKSKRLRCAWDTRYALRVLGILIP